MGLNSYVMFIMMMLGVDKFLVLCMDGQEQFGCLFEWYVDLVGNVNLLGMKEYINLYLLLGMCVNVIIDLYGVKCEFNGYVMCVQCGEWYGCFEVFSIVMWLWLWFVMCIKNLCVFQNKSVKDIVIVVLMFYSSDFFWWLLLFLFYFMFEYCVQYDESDFDFVSCLFEEVGIYYFFEYISIMYILVLIDLMVKYCSKVSMVFIEWVNCFKYEQCIMDWCKQEEV